MIGPGILVRMRITQAMSTKRNVHLHFLFPPHLVRVCYETSKEAYVYRLFDIFISLTPGMPFRSSIPISLYYILSILRGNYIRTSPGPFHLFISLFQFFLLSYFLDRANCFALVSTFHCFELFWRWHIFRRGTGKKQAGGF